MSSSSSSRPCAARIAAATSGSFSSSSSSSASAAGAASAGLSPLMEAAADAAGSSLAPSTSAAFLSSAASRSAFVRSQPKRTTNAVRSSWLPFSSALAMRASAAFCSLSPCLRTPLTSLTASLSLTTSQMPSLPNITNSSDSQSISWMVISGSAEMMSGRLKSLSPSARETARPMIGETRLRGSIARQTLLTSATPPPAASMRFFSSGRSGLWSLVRRTASPPPLPRTARESPRFARNRRSRICSSGPKTVIVQAVVPDLSSRRFACWRKLCSVCLKPPMMPFFIATSSLTFFCRSRSLARMFVARWAAAYSAQ
mmetsp:Transcript_75726/g.195136  ORF Transcript_75726/g.195136 Transcript_75726/m.195136 type:complete len:314 (-) Transcript_75726:828-1769(-)